MVVIFTKVKNLEKKLKNPKEILFMDYGHLNETLTRLNEIDFKSRGESYVEASFLFPLLECLGYEQHKDYEVIIHGDDKCDFKLNYPPVELGAKRVKHYNPDYVPTIRKKSFWVIEAKSAKDVNYPFDYSFVVQGLQYCIHPEIQAEYLVISNGIDTCIYEPYRAAYLDGDFFEPTFHFKNNEITNKWDQIYNFLSNEKVRIKIEQLLIEHYEKLAESSIDENYPERLWNQIGKNKLTIKQKIQTHVNKLKLDKIDESINDYQNIIEKLPSSVILEQYFDLPLGIGKSESEYFIEKRIKEKKHNEVFDELIMQYSDASIFRKEHIFASLSILYHKSIHPLNEQIQKWLIENSERDLNKKNRNETLLLRIVRKLLIISVYPELNLQIEKTLESAPEIIKFVERPNSLKTTYPIEIQIHHKLFNEIIIKSEADLDKEYIEYCNLDKSIDESFREAYKKLNGSEKQIGGFLHYGHGKKHYAFKNIMKHYNVITY